MVCDKSVAKLFSQKGLSMKRLALVMLVLAVISGCTSEPTQTEQKPQPTEVLTGRSAFQQLYVSARGWAADARPYQLQSQVIGDSKFKDGKAALWRAGFASQQMRGSKPYPWSVIDSPDAPSRGISPGTHDSHLPRNAFDINFLKVDSDKAFEVAQKHGGEENLQQRADNPGFYLLDWKRHGKILVLHVLYWDKRNDAKI